MSKSSDFIVPLRYRLKPRNWSLLPRCRYQSRSMRTTRAAREVDNDVKWISPKSRQDRIRIETMGTCSVLLACTPKSRVHLHMQPWKGSHKIKSRSIRVIFTVHLEACRQLIRMHPTAWEWRCMELLQPLHWIFVDSVDKVLSSHTINKIYPIQMHFCIGPIASGHVSRDWHLST